MMTFARTHDLALVRAAIAGDPRVYDASSDDSAPARAVWQPSDHPAIWYVIAGTRDAGFTGLYTFVPENAIAWQVHTTRVFGARAAATLSDVVRWFARQTGARRIVAAIPATNRAALRCALRAGFLEYGRDPRSWSKSGDLVDRVLVGISL